MDRDFTAWLAGFFDGEGCVGLYSSRHHRQVMLSVVLAQKDRTILDFIAACYPEGKVVPYKNRSYSKTGAIRECGTAHTYRIYGRNAKRFLEDIQPFSKVKKAQIDMALEFISLLLPRKPFGRGYPKTAPEVKARRDELMAGMKAEKDKLFSRAVN